MRRVADAAFPFDYSILPDDVGLVLGYVGQVGSTPHAWTNAEIAAVVAAGKQWRAIWVPPQRALTKQDGVDAAAGMIAALVGRGYPKGVSVFLDIEYSSYWGNPAGAQAAVAAWKAGMAATGWPLAYWYGPLGSPADWLAHWTGVAPTTLPAGLIGVQYDHALAGDRYDLSVFDEALWTRERLTTHTEAPVLYLRFINSPGDDSKVYAVVGEHLLMLNGNYGVDGMDLAWLGLTHTDPATGKVITSGIRTADKRSAFWALPVVPGTPDARS